MPLSKDLFDIIETITITNLANLTAPNPTLILPIGLDGLYTEVVTNNFDDLGLPSDVQDVVTAVVTNNPNLVIITA
jgi:hypothetical protein